MFNSFLEEYLSILIFLCVASVLSVIIVLIPRFLAVQKPEIDKLSPYECGFDPLEDSNKAFDIKFHLTAILFIIFDLEIMFMIPWAMVLGKLGMFEFCSMMVFIGVLTCGFIYEWRSGALEW